MDSLSIRVVRYHRLSDGQDPGGGWNHTVVDRLEALGDFFLMSSLGQHWDSVRQ
jgi:hypothetical protein